MKIRAGETGDFFIYFHLHSIYLRPFYEIEKYLIKSFFENKNLDYVDTNIIEFILTDIFNKLDKIIPESNKLLIKIIEVDSSNNNIIIRGLLKSLVTINYFQQSEKVFYKVL